EALVNYPEKINWQNIDVLILVAEHMRSILENYHSQIYRKMCDKIIIIPNGVDLNKFSFKVHSPGYNLAIVAHINHKKDPAMWLQVIGMLKKMDERYTLHIAGDFQEIRYANYFKHFIKDSGLEKNVKHYGFVNDVIALLEDKNYLLSTSIHESFGYNIAEAMARGIKPIIHNYAGAKTQWPEKLIYNFLDEIAIKLVDYDSESYRRFTEENCSIEKQTARISNLICSWR
ncbi:glycosyltransferase, partial [Pseudothermotoga sp.]|uniref:glycosyltransferase n=1 Tax=Pseudothermotoga sp. TaxID=2033661 RepID=UPI0031F6F4E3